MRTDRGARTQSHAAAHAHAATCTATTLASAARITACVVGALAATAAAPGHTLRPLVGDGDAGGNGLQIECLADKTAQRHYQRARVHGAAGHHVLRGLGGERHLLFGAQQNHIGQSRFHRIADAAAALGLGFQRFSVLWLASSLLAHLLEVAGIYRQLAGE